MIAYTIFGGRERYERAPADLKVTSEGVKVPGPPQYGPPDEAQVLACMDFLARCTPTKTGRLHSYGLKHAIERWSKERGGVPYVTNGAAIEAARRLGIVLEAHVGGINCFVGVSLRSVRKVSGER